WRLLRWWECADHRGRCAQPDTVACCPPVGLLAWLTRRSHLTIQAQAAYRRIHGEHIGCPSHIGRISFLSWRWTGRCRMRNERQLQVEGIAAVRERASNFASTAETECSTVLEEVESRSAISRFKPRRTGCRGKAPRR